MSFALLKSLALGLFRACFELGLLKISTLAPLLDYVCETLTEHELFVHFFNAVVV